MSHKSKSKAKGISASSFFDLKAELSKQEEDFARNKAAGKSTTIVGGVQRPDKKPTVWARQNKGIKSRAQHDVELDAVSKPTLDSARAALERKAKIYEKLRKGKSGGLNDKQYDALLVDFDSKEISDHWESDSDDVDESLAIAKPPEDYEDDPIIEYQDEFGRTRTGRRSEIPRHLLHNDDDNAQEDEDVIRNPINHFPVYEPSAERIAEIAQAHSEENNPLGVHYDASKEVRAKGAGFYQFSGDEETRKKQMEELKAVRDETERTRKDVGAVDLRPGESDGMRDGEGKSRAMDKRKRELEERRRLLDAKRRKIKGGEARAVPAPPENPSVFTASAASVSADSVRGPAAPLPPDDPFATLEAQSKSSSKGKRKTRPLINEADVFLAQLEGEILRGKSR